MDRIHYFKTLLLEKKSHIVHLIFDKIHNFETLLLEKFRYKSACTKCRNHTDFLSIFSWYFGAMTRAEATDILMSEKEGGVFLVRDSATIQGDYVLCVR